MGCYGSQCTWHKYIAPSWRQLGVVVTPFCLSGFGECRFPKRPHRLLHVIVRILSPCGVVLAVLFAVGKRTAVGVQLTRVSERPLSMTPVLRLGAAVLRARFPVHAARMARIALVVDAWRHDSCGRVVGSVDGGGVCVWGVGISACAHEISAEGHGRPLGHQRGTPHPPTQGNDRARIEFLARTLVGGRRRRRRRRQRRADRGAVAGDHAVLALGASGVQPGSRIAN